MAFADQFANIWKMNEASGAALDSVGSISITDNGSVGATVGLLSGCRTFNGSNQYFSLSSSADISPGDTDWWFYVWFYVTSFSANRQVFSKRNSNSNPEYTFWINTSARPIWGVGGTGSEQTWGSAISANAWHLACLYHSATNNQRGMSIDGSAFVSVSTSGPALTYSVPFRIGAKNSTPVIEFFAGRIDEIGFAPGFIPTNSDASFLWNGGAGIAYPFAVVENLTGSADGTSTVSGGLSVGKLPTGSSSGAATVAGTLSVVKLLTGSSQGTSSTQATITSQKTLEGNSEGVGSVSGGLSVEKLLTGASEGVASCEADLDVEEAPDVAELSGAAEGLATISGALSVGKSLGGVSSSVGISFATLQVDPYNIDLGCILYLDAAKGITLNGSNVVGWADQSGNGNHVAQVTPSNGPTLATVQNRQWLHIDNQGLVRSGYIGSGGDITVISLYRISLDNTVAFPRILTIVDGNSSTGGMDRLILFSYFTTNKGPYIGRRNTSGGAGIPVNAMPLGVIACVTGKFASPATTIGTYINGTLVGSSPVGSASLVAGGRTDVGGSGSLTKCDIAEIRVYDRGLSDAEIAYFTKKINTKWLGNLYGSSFGSSIAIGLASVGKRLVGLAAGAAIIAGSLSVPKDLTGSADGTSQAAGSLSVSKELQGSTAGQADCTAHLTVGRTLTETVYGILTPRPAGSLTPRNEGVLTITRGVTVNIPLFVGEVRTNEFTVIRADQSEVDFDQVNFDSYEIVISDLQTVTPTIAGSKVSFVNNADVTEKQGTFPFAFYGVGPGAIRDVLVEGFVSVKQLG